MLISDKQFETEFNVSNDKFLDMIVVIIKYGLINDLEMLSIAAKIAKYVE